MSRAGRVWPAALAAAALLTGCSSSTTTVTVQGPAATVRSATTQTTSSTASVPTPASAAPTSFLAEPSFQSPSGNIGCMIISGTARCDIVHHTWALPPRPASCPPIVDFGQGLIVEGSSRARIVCAGDTARNPAAPKLGYGTASRVEGFLCVSRSDGMRCTNRVSGHGFFLSIQSYLLF